MRKLSEAEQRFFNKVNMTEEQKKKEKEQQQAFNKQLNQISRLSGDIQASNGSPFKASKTQEAKSFEKQYGFNPYEIMENRKKDVAQTSYLILNSPEYRESQMPEIQKRLDYKKEQEERKNESGLKKTARAIVTPLSAVSQLGVGALKAGEGVVDSVATVVTGATNATRTAKIKFLESRLNNLEKQ